jgi:hypothetical protein
MDYLSTFNGIKKSIICQTEKLSHSEMAALQGFAEHIEM